MAPARMVKKRSTIAPAIRTREIPANIGPCFER